MVNSNCPSSLGLAMFGKYELQLKSLHHRINEKSEEIFSVLNELENLSKEPNSYSKVLEALHAYQLDSMGQMRALYSLLNGLRKNPNKTAQGYMAYELVCPRQFPHLKGNELHKQIFITKHKLFQFATENIASFVKFYNKAVKCLIEIKDITPRTILSAFYSYNCQAPNKDDLCNQFFMLFDKLQRIGFPGFKDKTLRTFMVDNHNYIGLWSGAKSTPGGARDKAFSSGDICEAIVSDLNFLFFIASNIPDNSAINNALSEYFVAHIDQQTSINIYLDTENTITIGNCLWDVELYASSLLKIEDIHIFMAQAIGAYLPVELENLFANRKNFCYKITIVDNVDDLAIPQLQASNPVICLRKQSICLVYRCNENKICRINIPLNQQDLLALQKYKDQAILLHQKDIRLFKVINQAITTYNSYSLVKAPKFIRQLTIKELKQLIEPAVSRVKEKKIFSPTSTRYLSHFSSTSYDSPRSAILPFYGGIRSTSKSSNLSSSGAYYDISCGIRGLDAIASERAYSFTENEEFRLDINSNQFPMDYVPDEENLTIPSTATNTILAAKDILHHDFSTPEYEFGLSAYQQISSEASKQPTKNMEHSTDLLFHHTAIKQQQANQQNNCKLSL